MTGIADDTFTFGKGESDHEDHLINVLDTARENNIRFNHDKFEFKVPEASFFGMKWTAKGLKVDNSKVQSIVNMEPPAHAEVNNEKSTTSSQSNTPSKCSKEVITGVVVWFVHQKDLIYDI